MSHKFTVSFIYTLLFLLTINNLFANPYWIRKNSPTSNNLKNVFFINNITGWVSGEFGTIMRTTNAGLNWEIQNTKIISDIQSVFFINERLGWALSYEVIPDSTDFLGTRILKTTNGGTDWINYMYPDSNLFMRSIYFLDSATGFMVGAPISIVRTGNAGLSWEKMDTDTNLQLGLPLENIKFINSQTGYACGGFRDIAGAMWTTTNGGFNWLGVIVAPEPFLDIYIYNPLSAIAVGGDFEYGSSYVTTTNQGRVWNYDTLGTFGIASAIDYRTPTEGWITLGIAQKFSFTTNRGASWNSIFTPDSIPLNDVQFTDSLNGWSVGLSGSIFKYNALKVNVNNFTDNIPETFELYQNYPNPFNPDTKINFRLNASGFVKLSVYDITGKEIKILTNQNLSVGKYSVDFSATDGGNSSGSGLPSGLYFYKVEFTDSDNKSTKINLSKKMLLIK